MRPSIAVVVAPVPLDHWLGEKLLVDSLRPNTPSTKRRWRSASLKVARETTFVFFTGCCSTAARPVSHAEPYFEAGEAHSTSS